MLALSLKVSQSMGKIDFYSKKRVINVEYASKLLERDSNEFHLVL